MQKDVDGAIAMDIIGESGQHYTGPHGEQNIYQTLCNLSEANAHLLQQNHHILEKHDQDHTNIEKKCLSFYEEFLALKEDYETLKQAHSAQSKDSQMDSELPSVKELQLDLERIEQQHAKRLDEHDEKQKKHQQIVNDIRTSLKKRKLEND